MIERRAFCDACKQPVLENLTVIQIAAGPLTAMLPSELHLCRDDAQRFASLIRGGAAELPGPGDLARDATPGPARRLETGG